MPLALRECTGRVLAADLLSPIDVPGHTNAAVDGYALRSQDLADSGIDLAITGRALAGHPFAGEVEAGCCVAITTGAPVPKGADSVVMQEYTRRVDDGQVRIEHACKAGDNIRRAGEDIRAGSRVAPAGTRISPALLGVLASLGLEQVAVTRRPRVALFSTGDEIQPPGEPLRPGGVYDSNTYILRGLLTDLGMDILDLGRVPDDPDQLRATLEKAAASGDAVITSGGVSVGEADHIKPLLTALGHMDFWKLAIKPGRPLTFGHLGDALFFGLPGNPVAVMVTFLQFARPALQKLAGMTPSPLPTLRALCDDRLRKRPGRREFQRGILSTGEDGHLHVGLTGRQGSGILTSMSRANCLIVLEESRGDVAPGDSLEIQLLPWALQGA